MVKLIYTRESYIHATGIITIFLYYLCLYYILPIVNYIYIYCYFLLFASHRRRIRGINIRQVIHYSKTRVQ